MCVLLNTQSKYIRSLLGLLIKDKSTGKNIIWATDSYRFYGDGFNERDNIELKLITGIFANDILVPRVEKEQRDQTSRTRDRAEVFTPSWICNQMNNLCDDAWFGRKGMFNTEQEKGWVTTDEKVEFPDGKKWTDYVDSTRLEVACGEAPYVVSRYDAATGEIIDVHSRIGLLDRKLRVVNENTDNLKEWVKWATRAYQSVYGYEFQGDNLLIARINLVNTFIDYYTDRWGEDPAPELIKKIADIVVWNFWQMDGMTEMLPFALVPKEEDFQITMFDDPVIVNKKNTLEEPTKCKIYDWREKKTVVFGE